MSAGLQVARTALPDRRAWLVGGAVRDRLLGRDTIDLDVVVEGDPAAAARAVAASAGRAVCFALSEQFGSGRVLARDGSWQLDIEPLRGAAIEQDLALRDFTVNAIAEPLAGGAPIDPLGGVGDLEHRRLRMAGPGAFAADPLRVLRLVRLAVELELEADLETIRAARAHAHGLAGVSPERVFIELRRILAAARARSGLEMMGELGASAIVLPELEALRGVEQNRFHHRDVYGHTLEVLDRTVELTSWTSADPDLARTLAPERARVAALLAEPLADGLSRGEALRWGALLHDVAKPHTRGQLGRGGGVSFIGHDVRGAELARAVLDRLRASERLRAHLAALVRHHLRLGFLVHEPQPLSRHAVFAYLRASAPVEVDVTLLSIADRLATRGDRAEESIAEHLRLAQAMLADALRWREQGPPDPLLRGDELASELDIASGPRIGALLERLAEAQYAGEVRTREQALAHARGLLGTI
jgi:poly(A) polymerase